MKKLLFIPIILLLCSSCSQIVSDNIVVLNKIATKNTYNDISLSMTVKNINTQQIFEITNDVDMFNSYNKNDTCVYTHKISKHFFNFFYK
jgi:hypothetical protein